MFQPFRYLAALLILGVNMMPCGLLLLHTVSQNVVKSRQPTFLYRTHC